MSHYNENKDGILLATGTNEVEFMEFQLNSVSYGINVSKIQRLAALGGIPVTKIPQAHPCVVGSIHNHGVPIKLLDLKEALGIQGQESTDSSRQLVMVTKFNSITTAFLIDSISKIHRLSWTLFDPISEAISTSADASFSTGTVTLDDRIIIILDLERLMLSYFPNAFKKDIINEKVDYDSARENKRIVYVEDSKVVSTMTMDLLNQAGYTQVKPFVNGEEAIRYIRENQDSVDVVLTDIEMPMMDGLTLCKNVKALEISEDDIAISVVIYSSLITPEMSKKCEYVGADAQLSKSEGPKILQTLDKICLSRN
ncbi:chemotaxis protein CheW [Puniceicoccaceae bacterium K14]|nr:chemotaxis protein CheW [Puniceicoccaceae bacterium K14]